MRSLLLSLALLLPACTGHATVLLLQATAGPAVQVAFLDSVNTGNSRLDDTVRAACRKVLENHGYKVTDQAQSGQIVIQVDLKQLAQPDDISAGKFIEVTVTDARTKKLISRVNQDAVHASDEEVARATELAISEFIQPSIPPPPARQ